MIELYPWQNDLWQRWNGLRSRLPHALLLKGAQGTGKFDFAMNIVQSVLCEMPSNNGWACEKCPSCHWLQQNSHPDFRLLQPEALSETENLGNEEGKKKPSRQISVDQVRALNDFANLSAHRGGRRIVLIHPAESMNINAANALLKTLEEPSPGMLIILVTHKPQQLLPTIRSRCLTLAVPMPTPEASTVWLEQQGIENPLGKLAQAGFSPLQVVRASEEEDADYLSFLNGLRQLSGGDACALAEQFQRKEPIRVITWMQQWCYDLTSASLTGKIRYNRDQIEYLNGISNKINMLDLLRYQKELLVAKREAQHPLNPRLLFESLFLSYRQILPST